MLASSCCPAFVSYVEKNFPDLAETLVSKTPSPMVMLGRHIKESEPEAKVVFIGPCVAKKREFKLGKTMAAIDCAITFEELSALFDARDIDIEALDEGELEDASGYGRSFAASGGVADAVVQALKEKGSDFEVKAVKCSGIAECKAALLKAKAGVLDANFIEGMACVGGCILGPANLIRGPKNKQELAQHAQQAVKTAVHDEPPKAAKKVPAKSGKK